MTIGFTHTAPKGKKKGEGRITGATLVYIKIKDGDLKYQSQDKEYSVDAVVDKATAKAFKKEFPKNGFKEIDTADFKEKYKIDPPLPNEDEQYVIKLATNVTAAVDIKNAQQQVVLKKGAVIPFDWASRPKIYEQLDEGVAEITFDPERIPANGSVGDIAFASSTNDFGTFPKLSGLLVTSLIPYEGKSGSMFGDVKSSYAAPVTAPESFDEEEQEESSEGTEPFADTDTGDKPEAVSDDEESENPFA